MNTTTTFIKWPKKHSGTSGHRYQERRDRDRPKMRQTSLHRDQVGVVGGFLVIFLSKVPNDRGTAGDEVREVLERQTDPDYECDHVY